jgi:uncharacterized protein with HEPN domain
LRGQLAARTSSTTKSRCAAPALERCLKIIGEAAKSIDEERRAAIPDVPWTEVIRLRTD